MGYVYYIKLLNSPLQENMKMGRKDARSLLKRIIYAVFVATLFLEQSHVQAKTEQTKFHINNVKYILNTSIR
jgi:hypothetical protein